jgi:hypothetical protein
LPTPARARDNHAESSALRPNTPTSAVIGSTKFLSR